MSCLSAFGPNRLVIISALVSILVADDLNADDLDLLANFVTSVGDLLALKAARLGREENRDDTKEQISLLEEQIRKLKDSLK